MSTKKKDTEKTKKELISELVVLRKQHQELIDLVENELKRTEPNRKDNFLRMMRRDIHNSIARRI